MISFKQAASLSSSLLARKGSAVPAALVMSPHALVPHAITAHSVTPPAVAPQPPVSQPPAPARMEGWLPPPAPSEPAPRRRPTPPVGRASTSASEMPPSKPGKSAKVSLRLDDERHRKLRLVSVHQHLSGQQILLAALDAYLAKCAGTLMDGNCVCLTRAAD
jgi:hypothetical protein